MNRLFVMIVLVGCCMTALAADVPQEPVYSLSGDLGWIDTLTPNNRDNILSGVCGREILEERLETKFKASHDIGVQMSIAYLLGRHRMENSAQMLAKHLDLTDHFYANNSQRLWGESSVVGALIRIGIPSIPFVIKNLATSDDKLVRERSLLILHAIEDREIAAIRLGRAIHDEQDPTRKTRLEAALAKLREEKQE